MILSSKKFLTAALLAALGFGAQAQSLADKFNSFTQQATQEYEDFRMQCNKAYADFMRHAWEEMDLLPPEPKFEDESVEPEIVYDTADDLYTNDGAEFYAVQELAPTPKPMPVPIAPIISFKWPEQGMVGSSFYGTLLKIRFDDRQKFSFASLDNDLMADTWLKCSGREYNNTISDCLDLRDKLSLNDWAYLRMVYQFAQDALGSDNEAVFLTAFIYAQSGYKMRLFRKSSTELGMLYATEERIYGEPFIRTSDGPMYSLTGGFGSISTCNVPFENEQALSLGMSADPVFEHDYGEVRTLQSKRYPEIKVDVKVDRNLMRFYDDYPQFTKGDDPLSRWSVYANMPLAEDVKAQLYPVLKEAIKDCDQRLAVNKILNFLQTAFPYGYDSEIWGYDRAFFSEESLFYPLSDCEDHAILFTRLVRDLVGIPTALIYYPGHLGAAVAFDKEEHQHGDYVMVDGKKYTITDPTFKETWVGRSMTNHPPRTATPILLKD